MGDSKQKVEDGSKTEPFFVVDKSDDEDEEKQLLPKERHGDVISAHRALLTLMKGFVGSGCLSLPYAWKQGGLWVRLWMTRNELVVSGILGLGRLNGSSVATD